MRAAEANCVGHVTEDPCSNSNSPAAAVGKASVSCRKPLANNYKSDKYAPLARVGLIRLALQAGFRQRCRFNARPKRERAHRRDALAPIVHRHGSVTHGV